MVWRLTRAQARNFQKPSLPNSLEELCVLIKGNVEKNGKTWGTIVFNPSKFYNREYRFSGTFYAENTSDLDRDEIIRMGIDNLKFLLPDYDVTPSGKEDVFQNNSPERIMVAKKPVRYRES